MSTIAATAVSSIQEIEVVDVVRTCIRAAVSAALMYGAFSVFVLFAWQWLAVVLALVAGAAYDAGRGNAIVTVRAVRKGE